MDICRYLKAQEDNKDVPVLIRQSVNCISCKGCLCRQLPRETIQDAGLARSGWKINCVVVNPVLWVPLSEFQFYQQRGYGPPIQEHYDKIVHKIYFTE